MPFKTFGLSEPLVQGILATGYTTPTEIQSQAIPVALDGHDVIGCAQTGTGKTATPEIAQESHSFIRGLLKDLFGDETAGLVRILYGGSVKGDNICLLYTSPSPRDRTRSRMPSSA